MRNEDIERVFGRGRLKMATGEHVEVFREEVLPGERRRYTKRFLTTGDADFREWTAREWRMLARLIGHGIRCVPDVVRFDGAPEGGMRQVQTYDAGPTVEQWATLLPVARDGVAHQHAFEDCAHWFALAHYCLAALDDVHALQLVHLDIKADNLCIPYNPASFDPYAPDALFAPAFARLALIDFAFSLVSHEMLASALPIGWQKDYDYQSPRLLRALEAGRDGDLGPTQELDWRCDLYSLAAMLKRYLPDDGAAEDDAVATRWNRQRYDDARALIFRLREAHDADVPSVRPHRGLLSLTSRHLADPELAESLDRGWTIAHDAATPRVAARATPMTRIVRARPVSPAPIPSSPEPIAVTWGASVPLPAVVRNPRRREVPDRPDPAASIDPASIDPGTTRPKRVEARRTVAVACALGSLAALAIPLLVGDATRKDESPAPMAADAVGSDDRAASPDLATANPLRSTEQPTTGVERSPSAESAASDGLPRPAEGGDAASTAEPSRSPRSNAAITPSQGPAIAAATAGRPTAGSGAPKAKSRESPARTAHGIGHGGGGRSSARASLPATGTRKPAAELASSTQRQRDARATAARSLVAVAPTRSPIAAAPPAPKNPLPATTASEVRGPDANVALASVPPAQNEIALASAALPPVAQDASTTRVIEPASPSAPPADVASTVTPTPSGVPRAAAPRTPQDPLAQAAKGLADALRSGLRQLFRGAKPADQRPAPVRESDVLALSSSPVPRPPAPAAPPSLRAPSLESGSVAMPSDATMYTSPSAPPPNFGIGRAPSDTIAYPPPSAFGGVTRTRIATPDPVSVDALRLISEVVPTVAAQARSDAADALWMAALADRPSQNRAVFDAVDATWPSERVRVASRGESGRARTMHDDARRAFETGRSRQALGIEMHAFAADPRDPDIAGFLAYLHLQAMPAQPETARQLALHALAISGAQRARRIDDWNTFAVASALTGREVDATRAFLVQVALTTDLDRTCRAAQRALATHGERLRVPVQAMLDRIRTQRRDEESLACGSPSYPITARWQ